jgi:hypothetical protein
VTHGDVTIGQKIDQSSRGVIITSTKGIIDIDNKGDQHSQATLTVATTYLRSVQGSPIDK